MASPPVSTSLTPTDEEEVRLSAETVANDNDDNNYAHPSQHGPAAIRSSRDTASYASVQNPDVQWTPSTRNWSSIWIKVLLVLVLALIIDVVFLTARILQDQDNDESSTSHSDDLTKADNSNNSNNSFLLDKWSPLPSPETKIMKLAFGSCAHQKMPQPYWDTLQKYQPDVTILMGDNVYGDCTDETCTELQQAYSDWAALPSFQGAKHRLPMIATLDDHDYGLNDCDGNNPHKFLAKQFFLDFFDIYDERRVREKDGVYKSYEWGPEGERVQVILLDTRFHRSAFLGTDEPGAPGKERYIEDTQDTSKIMLSEEQWTWLEQQLQQPANVRLVVSSIQVLADGTGYECWRLLPHERSRLLDLLQQYNTNDDDDDNGGASGNNSVIFLLSGDRHVGGFYEYNDLVEVTASSWTHSVPLGEHDNCTSSQQCDEVDFNRRGDFVRVNNFGSMEFDWTSRTVTLGLRRAESSPYVWVQEEYEISGKQTDAGEMIQSKTYSIP